jgi:methylmalonyl-CoA mutase cobalamin-binding subunit
MSTRNRIRFGFSGISVSRLRLHKPDTFGDETMTSRTDLYEVILFGHSIRAEDSARCALSAGMDAAELFTNTVSAALRETRRRFQAHEFFVPEVLVTCRAMKAAMRQSGPRLAGSDFQPLASVAVLSLLNARDDLIASLVAAVLESAGFEVTQSNLAVSADRRAEQLRTVEAAAVVLVMPIVPGLHGARCSYAPVRDTLADVCRDCAQSGAKVVFVAGGLGRPDDLPVDAYVDDFMDVALTVETLLQEPHEVSSAMRAQSQQG